MPSVKSNSHMFVCICQKKGRYGTTRDSSDILVSTDTNAGMPNVPSKLRYQSWMIAAASSCLIMSRTSPMRIPKSVLANSIKTRIVNLLKSLPLRTHRPTNETKQQNPCQRKNADIGLGDGSISKSTVVKAQVQVHVSWTWVLLDKLLETIGRRTILYASNCTVYKLDVGAFSRHAPRSPPFWPEGANAPITNRSQCYFFGLQQQRDHTRPL